MWTTVLAGLAIATAMGAPPRAGAAFRVFFDQGRYAGVQGQTVRVQVRIDPVPASGLLSYGVKLSFAPTEIRAASEAAITVPPELDYNGFFGRGAIREVAPGYVAVKGTVNVLAQPLRTYTNALLCAFELTPLKVGEFDLTLDFYRTVGPNEDLFIDGDRTTLDSPISFAMATLAAAEADGLRVRIESNASSGQPPPQVTVSYRTCPHFDYFVEYCEDLSPAPAWRPLPGGPHNAGSVIEPAEGPRRFYRVRAALSSTFPLSITVVPASEQRGEGVRVSFPVSDFLTPGN